MKKSLKTVETIIVYLICSKPYITKYVEFVILNTIFRFLQFLYMVDSYIFEHNPIPFPQQNSPRY